MLHNLSTPTLLPLRLPPLHPLRHLRARSLAADVYGRDNAHPIGRQCKTRQLKERRVFRVRHAEDLQRRAGVLVRCDVGVRVGPRLRLRDHCGYRR